MKKLSRHTAVLGRLVLLLFVLANTGFTAVINRCSMGSDTPMSCCGNSGTAASTSHCDGRFPSDFLTIGNRFDCHTTTIVGGSAALAGLLQQENTSRSRITLHPLNQYFHSVSLSCPYTEGLVVSSLPPRPSSPSVEKCILLSTFLI